MSDDMNGNPLHDPERLRWMARQLDAIFVESDDGAAATLRAAADEIERLQSIVLALYENGAGEDLPLDHDPVAHMAVDLIAEIERLRKLLDAVFDEIVTYFGDTLTVERWGEEYEGWSATLTASEPWNVSAPVADWLLSKDEVREVTNE